MHNHLAHMIRSRAEKYGSREVFRHKVQNRYQSISWSSFKTDAEQISKYLLSIGVEALDNIGILANNQPQWTTADLGIISVRGVVIPLYTTATLEQINYIVEETQMRVMFVGNNAQLKLAQKAMRKSDYLQLIICIERPGENAENVVYYEDILQQNLSEQQLAFETRLQQAEGDDLITIIYTSGTTGEPKGVMLHHRNFMASFKIHDKRLVLGEDDVSMCFLPLTHVFERIWTYYLMYRGAVNTYNSDPKAVIDEISVVKPTVMCAIPRFFEKTHHAIVTTVKTWPNWKQQLFKRAIKLGLKYIEYQKDGLKVPAMLALKHRFYDTLVYSKIRKVFGGHVRYFPCAGAALRKDLLQFFHAIGIFINYGYGSTETTATVSCMPQKHYDFDYTGDILPDIEVKISDEGMILVKGDIVFSGYYKKPEETAKTLIDGWYYTGDKGYIPAPGKLHMTERMKDIIKTSTGKYISPQKIENLIQQSHLIEQACVIGDNRKYLVALVVPCYDNLKTLGRVLKFNNVAEMVADEEVEKTVLDDMQKYQSTLPLHERVAKIYLLPEPFTIEGNTLTTTLKMRRKHITEQYQSVIETLYES